MARSIMDLVKEMRTAPPRNPDDPRFDELEQIAAEMGGEAMPEDGMSPEGSMSPEDGLPPEMSPEDQDAAMMDEAMGGAEGAVSPEGIPSDAMTPEEEMLAGGKGAPGASSQMKRPNPLMKKKKSSYLAGM